MKNIITQTSKSFLLVVCLAFSISQASTVDISHEQFAEMQANSSDLVLLDVRSQEEFSKGHIEGAVNIPHSNIQEILKQLNTNDSVVIYCRSGRRVGLVADILENKGYNKLHHLDGDMNKWLADKKPIVKP